jgi:hypothetical protein
LTHACHAIHDHTLVDSRSFVFLSVFVYLPLTQYRICIIIHHFTDHALHPTLTHSRKSLHSLFTRALFVHLRPLITITTQMASSIMRICFDLVPFLYFSIRYPHPP